MEKISNNSKKNLSKIITKCFLGISNFLMNDFISSPNDWKKLSTGDVSLFYALIFLQ